MRRQCFDLYEAATERTWPPDTRLVGLRHRSYISATPQTKAQGLALHEATARRPPGARDHFTGGPRNTIKEGSAPFWRGIPLRWRAPEPSYLHRTIGTVRPDPAGACARDCSSRDAHPAARRCSVLDPDPRSARRSRRHLGPATEIARRLISQPVCFTA